jgi:hypothetical protein
MAIAIVPLTRDLEPAVQRFNQRMRDGDAPSAFLLPERAATPKTGIVRAQQFVAVEGEEVRGGILILEHPGYFDTRSTEAGVRRDLVINLQAPLSEAIIDSRYAMVSIQLIRFAVKHCPMAYVVGMGSADRPLPRLLKASGWTVRPIPFFFQILRASASLRELQPLRRRPPLRLAAMLAGLTGIGAMVLAIVQRPRVSAAGLRSKQVTDKSEDGAREDDATWAAVEPRLSFSVVRDSTTLPQYLWRQVERHRVYRSDACAGWFSLMLSSMRGHSYFGNLKVATLIDVIARDRADTAAIVVLAVHRAREEGCDLVVSNQLHRELQEALARAGFVRYSSNFLLATSSALSAAMRDESSLISRQDGDGLVNLRER